MASGAPARHWGPGRAQGGGDSKVCQSAWGRERRETGTRTDVRRTTGRQAGGRPPAAAGPGTAAPARRPQGVLQGRADGARPGAQPPAPAGRGGALPGGQGRGARGEEGAPKGRRGRWDGERGVRKGGSRRFSGCAARRATAGRGGGGGGGRARARAPGGGSRSRARRAARQAVKLGAPGPLQVRDQRRAQTNVQVFCQALALRARAAPGARRRRSLERRRRGAAGRLSATRLTQPRAGSATAALGLVTEPPR
jgi:hypothetical protein